MYGYMYIYQCWHTQLMFAVIVLKTYIYLYIYYIYTLPAKSMEYFEAQWKHSYLTFWFAGNGLVPTTTKYCHFNAFLMHSVRGEK